MRAPMRDTHLEVRAFICCRVESARWVGETDRGRGVTDMETSRKEIYVMIYGSKTSSPQVIYRNISLVNLVKPGVYE